MKIPQAVVRLGFGLRWSGTRGWHLPTMVGRKGKAALLLAWWVVKCLVSLAR